MFYLIANNNNIAYYKILDGTQKMEETAMTRQTNGRNLMKEMAFKPELSVEVECFE